MIDRKCKSAKPFAMTTTAVLLVAGGCLSMHALAEERTPGHMPSHPAEHAARSASPTSPARPHGPVASASQHFSTPHLQFDSRYNHNHYYPARGYVVGSLPPGYASYTWGAGRYFYHGGVWFRPRGNRYIVVAPPFGLIIPILPFGYSTLWVSGSPYYYADDVYYVPTSGGYRVVEPPQSSDIIIDDGLTSAPAPIDKVYSPTPRPTYQQPPAVPAGEALFVYPKNGQTATQTSFDRIECDRWAIGQTGFDPSQPSADSARRANFQRAAAACLEGRGYTVK